MASYHFHTKHVTRSKGYSSVGAIAYRTASRLRDDIGTLGMPLTEICAREYSDSRQRQLFKNIVYVGALAALLDIEIGVVESLIGDQFKLQGGFWSATDVLTDDKYFGWIGFGIIALFALSWIVSIIIYRMNDYDSIEVRPGNSPLS